MRNSFIPISISGTLNLLCLQSALTLILFKLGENTRELQGLFLLMAVETLVPVFLQKHLASALSRIPPRSLFLGSSLVSGICCIGFFFFPQNLVSALILSIPLVLFVTVTKAAWMAIPASISDISYRQKLNSRFTSLMHSANLGGYFIAGTNGYLGGHKNTFLVLSLISVFSAIILNFYPHDSGHLANDKTLGETKIDINDIPNTKRDSFYFSILCLQSIFWVVAGALNILEIPIAKDQFEADDMMLSWLFISVSVGAILSSPLISKLPLNKIQLLSCSNFLLFSLTAIYSQSSSIYLAVVILFLIGVSASLQNISFTTLLQGNSSSNLLEKRIVESQVVQQVSTLAAAAIATLVAMVFQPDFTLKMFCIVGAVFTMVIILVGRRNRAT